MEFIIFKFLYPFPDFFDDSYSYIFAAYAHLKISIWPIGYSIFLSAFHWLTASDTALVAFQYFFLQSSVLWLFFTIIYFYESTNATRVILIIFLFANPLSLYLSNTIASDALFSALSIIWITELIWIIHRPHFSHVIIQAILLLLCFSLRNNAYYYPVIAILAFGLSRHKRLFKWMGSVLSLLLIALFVMWTRNSAKQLTGVSQYSLFTGWQLANNALYIYDQIKVDSNTLPTPEIRELNRSSIAYFKHVNPTVYTGLLRSYVGNFFIRQPEAPLKQYFTNHYAPKNEMGIIIAWAKCSAIYSDFGKLIISDHPIAYFRYFIIPNFWHYILPPLSHLEIYNYGTSDIDPIAKYWFHYPALTIYCFSRNIQRFLIIYSAIFLLANLYFGWQWVSFSTKEWKSLRDLGTHATYWLVTTFLLSNLVFSLAATVNILRYQVTPMIALVTFGCVLNDYLEKRTLSKKPTSSASAEQLSRTIQSSVTN